MIDIGELERVLFGCVDRETWSSIQKRVEYYNNYEKETNETLGHKCGVCGIRYKGPHLCSGVPAPKDVWHLQHFLR